METQELDALRFLPFLAEATAMLGTSFLVKRWMRPPPNFGGRYWRSFLAAMASLPFALTAVFVVGLLASIAYQSAGGQPEIFSGQHLATFMVGTVGRTFLIWPFAIAWLVVKPKQLSPETAPSIATPTPKAKKEPKSKSIPTHPPPDASRTATLETSVAYFGLSRIKLMENKTIIATILFAAALTLAATAYWYLRVFPIQRAESTRLDEIFEDSSRYRRIIWDDITLQSKAIYGGNADELPVSVNCRNEKYLDIKRKLPTSVAYNNTVESARSAERAAIKFDEKQQHDLAAQAEAEAALRFFAAEILRDEIECFEMARGPSY